MRLTTCFILLAFATGIPPVLTANSSLFRKFADLTFFTGSPTLINMSDTLAEVQKFIEGINKTEKAAQSDDEPVGILPSRSMVFKERFRFDEWPEREENLRMDMLGFIEQFFYDHKKLPVKADFELRFKPADLPKSFNGWKDLLLSLVDGLEARGLPTFEVLGDYLPPEFIAAVSLILNYHDKRTVNAKLKEIGLTTKKFNAWMRIDTFREYYERRLNEVVDDDLINNAKLGLSRLVTNDDLQAIKFSFEVKNLYRPQQQNQQQLLTIMQILMEILAKNVSKDVLNTVASEIRSHPLIMGELS